MAISLALVISGAFLGISHFRSDKQHAAQYDYDIVVVGAGPGGVAASLQAARMGAHVALLEPTDWVGGQMTAAAVGTMDEGSPKDRSSGIYKEFVQRVAAYYHSRGKSIDTCYYATDSICADPQVGQQILRQMLATQSDHIKLYTDTQVAQVNKNGNTVTGVETASNERFNAKVVVDASEYGDVLADAGAAYRLGNGTAAQPNQNACVQKISYPAVIKEYPNGVPKELIASKTPPGYAGARSHFTKVITKQGFDFFTAKRYPINFASFASYRGLPDLSNTRNYSTATSDDGAAVTRTTINLPNDFPISTDLTTTYVTDPKTRANDTCQAKLLTLDFIYYMQHDLGETNWSIANDEGYDTTYNTSQNHCAAFNGYTAIEENMPQEPYVREARRLIGIETLTSGDLQRITPGAASSTRFADSIAVGYYPMDLHGCDAPNTLEPDLDPPQNAVRAANEQSTFNGNAGPFEIPEGALIPEEVDGLLAAEKNISTSRLANGAIREQPIAMAIGQAVGALAALAAQHGEQPRAINPQMVRDALTASGAIVDIPPDTHSQQKT